MFEAVDITDEQSAARHRARYQELEAQAAARRAEQGAPETSSPARSYEGQALSREIVPAGWYTAMRLRVGQHLRIVNSTGRATVALQLWNAIDPSERLYVGDTAKLQWTTRLTTGSLLFSDMGRVLASIVEDGADGLLTGASDEVSNQHSFGRSGLRHSHGNFLLAAAKLGLSRRDVHPCVSLFANVQTTGEGRLVWGGPCQPGDAVELRAELPLLIALSNCPHPLDPAKVYDPGDAAISVMESSGDVSRAGSEEAERAFENTRAWLAANGEPQQ